MDNTITVGILSLMATLMSIALGWFWTIIKDIKSQKFVTQESMDKRLEAMEKQFVTEFKAANRELTLIVENINDKIGNINQKIELSHANLLSEIKVFLNNKKNLP